MSKELVPIEKVEISEKLTKKTYLRFLKHDLDEYELQLTEKEALRIQKHLQKLSTGSFAMVPIFCGGTDFCPFAERCPLSQIGKSPVGKVCILESQLLKEWAIRYFEEYDVDPENFTEIGYVNELAEIEIRLMRINMSLAKPGNAEMIIDQTVGVNREGLPVVQKQISPFIEIREKLLARKSKIIKLMVGDRQEKYKKEAALKQRDDSDTSSQQALLHAKLRELQRTMDSGGQPALSPQDIIDAEWEGPGE